METQELSFENTEIAFSSRSNKDLQKSLLLFSAFNNKFIVKASTSLIYLSLKHKLPVKNLVKGTVFKHFCGGESIKDCSNAIQRLQNYNIGSILDYAVEGEENEKAFETTCEEILKVIEKAQNSPSIPFAVFKPTGIASKKLMTKIQNKVTLTEKEENCFQNIKKRFDRICKKSFDKGVKLFIDSEDSWYQDVVDELVYEMMEKYNNEKAIVFNTFQMYRKDMPSRLKSAFQDALNKGYFLGAKLVRGAYMEKERERAEKMNYPDPIFPDKESTDKAFNHALDFCMENVSRISVCCGSHNEESNYHLISLINKNRLKKDDERIYFAQLYGMSDHITYNLAQAGYNVVKYVPYGPVEAVVPYLIRRAEENTSIAGQTSRELQLIRKEIKRRRINRK